MKQLQLRLDLTGVIVTIAVGVLLPVMLATAVGIVALVIAKDAGGIVTGVLVVSFAVTAMGSALITVVLTGRKARLARRQADFVANVSHELRTPLSAIKLYAQTLQSETVKREPEQTDRCVATILREAEWLDVLIDRVLTWRASSDDMLSLNLQVQPLTDAVNGALERFRAMVLPDEVALSASLESRQPVRHDRRAINTVVLNLLTNAYKYTGRDKQIHVGLCDEDGAAVIRVRDNGVGMTHREARRVFEPFYRVEEQETGASGVGLGLAISRYIVGRHDGDLEVESRKGKGSTFTIRLPAAPRGEHA